METKCLGGAFLENVSCGKVKALQIKQGEGHLTNGGIKMPEKQYQKPVYIDTDLLCCLYIYLWNSSLEKVLLQFNVAPHS